MINSGHYFFGRKSVIDLIKRRVIDLKEGYRQNIALLGHRYLGKTAILQHFLANLDDQDVIEIYLDLEDKDFDGLFYKFVGNLLYNFSRNKHLTLHEELDLLMESTRKFLPQTIQEIKKIQGLHARGKIMEAYQSLLALPEIFTQESGKFCVILLDEFQSLENIGGSDIFQELGKKIMTQRRCLYVVVSSSIVEAKKILSEKLSLLFGNFEIVDVGAFDPKTSQDFLEYHLQAIKMNPQLRNFLIDFTAGHPFYLNVITQEILRLSSQHHQPEVFLPLLTQAIENLIFSRWGVLSQHFDYLMHNLCQWKTNRVISNILIALANGKYRLKEILEETAGKSGSLQPKLARLIEEGMIAKNGNYYCFQDKLLRFWIKYVYERKLCAINENPLEQKAHFRQEMKDCVQNFQTVSEKDLSTRIVDLLHCFDNEALNINGRRYKLPAFRDIAPFKLVEEKDCHFSVIRARSAQKETWFFILKKEPLQEGEVNAFLTQAKKLNERPVKSIIIALSDLDVNARLKALQEKFWIWNEPELNTLLHLFDKPYIVK